MATVIVILWRGFDLAAHRLARRLTAAGVENVKTYQRTPPLPYASDSDA